MTAPVIQRKGVGGTCAEVSVGGVIFGSFIDFSFRLGPFEFHV